MLARSISHELYKCPPDLPKGEASKTNLQLHGAVSSTYGPYVYNTLSLQIDNNNVQNYYLFAHV